MLLVLKLRTCGNHWEPRNAESKEASSPPPSSTSQNYVSELLSGKEMKIRKEQKAEI